VAGGKAVPVAGQPGAEEQAAGHSTGAQGGPTSTSLRAMLATSVYALLFGPSTRLTDGLLLASTVPVLLLCPSLPLMRTPLL
jgi:hypothetical protein